MIPLGKINLRDERSIAEAEYKISLLAQALKFSSMDVTRLVTFTSKLGRNILGSRKPNIRIGIEKKEKTAFLNLTFHACAENLDTPKAEIFFDDIKSHRTKEKFKDVEVFKLIPDPAFALSKNFTAWANNILNPRSREELFEELNKTNKEAEEKLRSAQSQVTTSEKLAGIGQLSAGVCHEVLNPLNILSIHIQMLLTKRKQDAELQTSLEKIMNEVKRIDKIVRTLMTFARKKDMQAKWVQVGAELESALSLFEKDFQTDNITIIKEIDAELPELWADADELRQVILDIINNAKYAMRDGGVLTVSAKRWAKNGSSFVRLKFSDTGTGIKKEHFDKIFDPFFTTKPEGQGTGMGLSVAHDIVAKHGGTIQVESEEGQGAAFIIDLPIK